MCAAPSPPLVLSPLGAWLRCAFAPPALGESSDGEGSPTGLGGGGMEYVDARAEW